jgi:hypothetical protein
LSSAWISRSEFFGALSILMMICSRGNYFRSIFQGKTKPHAFSWFIWGVISSIGFAAQVAEGAGAGAWARGFAAVTNYVLVVVALLKGAKNIRRSDWVTLTVALATIPLWVITKTPVWSVIILCIIDTLGYFPTVRKSWDKPNEEAAVSYALSSFGALFAILAVEHYTLSTWLYSAVLTWSNGSMALFLLLRRRLTRH